MLIMTTVIQYASHTM